MRNYIYILELDKEYSFITFNNLIDKINFYCNENNIKIKKISKIIIQNILTGKTRNNYHFIKRLERMERPEYIEKYLKEELELRFPDYKTKSKVTQQGYISKILKRRGIN